MLENGIENGIKNGMGDGIGDGMGDEDDDFLLMAETATLLDIWGIVWI